MKARDVLATGAVALVVDTPATGGAGYLKAELSKGLYLDAPDEEFIVLTGNPSLASPIPELLRQHPDALVAYQGEGDLDTIDECEPGPVLPPGGWLVLHAQPS